MFGTHIIYEKFELSDRLIKFLKFMACEDAEELKRMADEDEDLKDAYDTIVLINSFIFAYDNILEKYGMKKSCGCEVCKIESIEIKNEVINTLFQMGASYDAINDITGISLADIRKCLDK